MPRYKNTKTGRVVTVADEATTRTNRPGRAKQWAHLLDVMNRSKRWRRLDPDQPAEDDNRSVGEEGDKPEPAEADIRAWAKDEGIEVSSRGRLPAELIERYKAAQAS